MVDTTAIASGVRLSREDFEEFIRIPQHVKVRNHLMRFGSITVKEAENFYEIHRLAAVIEQLRHKIHPVMFIDTETNKEPNAWGIVTPYAKYIYRGEEDAEYV